MQLDELLKEAKTVAIFGHVRPDGDCVGSTLGLYNYICDNYPTIKTSIYLERFPESYKILPRANEIIEIYEENNKSNHYEASEPYDLAILLDTPSYERVGANGESCLKSAKKTCNIDHHISNPLNLCTINFVDPKASSASEVLYFLLDTNKISKDAAECFYLGIVHDTGAFKFSSTGQKTMVAIGDLLDKGIDFTRLMNETYFTRTYIQTLVTGYVMMSCKLALDGKVVYSYMTPEDMDRYSVTPVELSNVIDTLREVSGTEVAIFLYPVNGEYKISLRSNYVVDVNKIASNFGGGGHVRAAGGSSKESPEETIKKLLLLIQEQLIK
ncbi:bifunctional oligoribonuclease/PAP phosphatase NrnA [Fibrobacter sp.]|uniref:DHH family phosphoesterase n=1 Tax=Fibrobacter sp. TaxID=35828 RepID=UPI0025BDEAF5|nr:bifunctional oligoribonuclease/PAP phosphatase NrnA [Fibrobacter sp.]MBR3072141.1 bifunctional oligoribonuclease/PAP phosphatase NrnA [Fibrobacter sp.]